jgi:phage gpG-like protein
MSASFEPDKINVKGLKQLVKALGMEPPVARLGILGDKAGRRPSHGKKATVNNATIGAVHEYGSPARGIPARSFLRVPLNDNLQGEMEKSGAFTKEQARDVIKTGSLVPWLRQVAVLGEGVVRKAFATGGGGKWPKWKNPNYTNNTGMLLIDTTQLRDSIVSDIKETA